MAIRLFIFDLEGTAISYAPLAELKETPSQHAVGLWARIAHALGPRAVALDAELARAWDDGRFTNYTEWCNASLVTMKNLGLTKTIFDMLLNGYTLSPGIIPLVQKLAAQGVVMAIISGGFWEQARRVQTQLGLLHVYAAADLTWNDGGKLDSWALSPSDYRGKVGYLHLLMEEYGIRASECAFVGDSANDMHIAPFVGRSFAYRASPRLKEVSTHVISHLDQILEHI